MKRPVIVLLFLALLAAFFVAIALQKNPNAPSYTTLQTQPSGPFPNAHYDWSEAAPFVDGKVWVFTILSRTNGHEYLFDLENHKVLGELFKAGSVFSTADHSKLLCEGYASMATSFKGQLIAMLGKISHGLVRIHTNNVETFWILNLRNNVAHRVGSLDQYPGTSSSWRTSPDFRFGVNVPNNGDEGHSLYLCDLEKETFHKIKFDGNVRGWWDAHNLMIKTPAGDFVLFDVLSEKATTLLTLASIASRLKAENISAIPSDATTISTWNGTNFDFALAGKEDWSRYTNGTYIFKMERPDGRLTLLETNFFFHWSGIFNDSQTLYVYGGENGAPGAGGNGGVFLIDLKTRATNTLIPPDNSGQYTIPQFYHDHIIYFKNRLLWSVDINGSNIVRVFPPPK